MPSVSSLNPRDRYPRRPAEQLVRGKTNMSKQAIKASDGFTILGYIETMPDGKQRGLAKDGYTILGYFDAQRNATLGKDGYTTLATGNVLSGLIYEKR